MYKIGVLGKKESAICFMSSGFEVCYAENAEKAMEGLKKLIELSCALIFVTNELSECLADEIERYKKIPTPAIITIPSMASLKNT